MDTPDVREYDWGRELLKWVAVATMTVDHVGLILFPDYLALRIIGRIAFPLFAYLLVLGMRSTHNLRGYFNRLIFFAFLSQVPYSLANGIEPWVKLNIFFTLILGLIMVYLIERSSVAFVIPLIVSVVVPVDYGVYGTATVLLLYLIRKDWKMGSTIFVLINLVLALSGAWYQPFALLALPLILLHDRGRLTFGRAEGQLKHPRFRKYFFYAYYPLHLMVLWGLKMIIS
ncbi:MAG: TraX family protein [Candidatus Bathyarchaeota archaeon]|nr:TraX family protein [Candidatus Bathyarchaeota archaeon]